MRRAALPDFRKLYRRITEGDYTKGLPAGNYSLEITYSILSCKMKSHWSDKGKLVYLESCVWKESLCMWIMVRNDCNITVMVCLIPMVSGHTSTIGVCKVPHPCWSCVVEDEPGWKWGFFVSCYNSTLPVISTIAFYYCSQTGFTSRVWLSSSMGRDWKQWLESSQSRSQSKYFEMSKWPMQIK